MIIRTELYNHTFSPIKIYRRDLVIRGNDKKNVSQEQGIKTSTFVPDQGVLVKPFQTVEQFTALKPLVEYYNGQIYFDETIYTDSTLFGNFGAITGIYAPIHPKKFLFVQTFPFIGSFDITSINSSNLNNVLEFSISLRDTPIIQMFEQYFTLLGLKFEIKNIKFQLDADIYNMEFYIISEGGEHIAHHEFFEELSLPAGYADNFQCDHFGISDKVFLYSQIQAILDRNGDFLKLYYDESEKDQKIYGKISYKSLKEIISNLQTSYNENLNAFIENLNKQQQLQGDVDTSKYLEPLSKMIPVQSQPIGFDVVYKLSGGGEDQLYNLKLFSGIILQGDIPSNILGGTSLNIDFPEFKYLYPKEYILLPNNFQRILRVNEKYFLEFNILSNVPINKIKKARVKNIYLDPRPSQNYKILLPSPNYNGVNVIPDFTGSNIQFANTNEYSSYLQRFILHLDTTQPINYQGKLIVELDDTTDPNNIKSFILESIIDFQTDTAESGRLFISILGGGKAETRYYMLGTSLKQDQKLQNYHKLGYVKIKKVNVKKFQQSIDPRTLEEVYTPFKKEDEEAFNNVFLVMFNKNFKDYIIGPQKEELFSLIIEPIPNIEKIKEQNKYLGKEINENITIDDTSKNELIENLFNSNHQIAYSIEIVYEDSTGKEQVLTNDSTARLYEDLIVKTYIPIQIPEVQLKIASNTNSTFSDNYTSFSSTLTNREAEPTLLIFKNQILEFPIKFEKVIGLTILDADIKLKRKIDGRKTDFTFGQDYFINKSEALPIGSAPAEFMLMFDLEEEGIQEFDLILKTDNRFLPEIRYSFKVVSIDLDIRNYITQDVGNFFVEDKKFHIALNKLTPKEVLLPIRNYSKLDIKILDVKVQSTKDKYGVEDLEITLYKDFIDKEIKNNKYYLLKAGDSLDIPAKILAKDYGFNLGFIILLTDPYGEIWLPISAFCNNRVDRNVYIYKTSPSYVQVLSAVGNTQSFYIKYKNFGDDPAIMEQDILGLSDREYYTVPYGVIYPRQEVKYPIIFLPFGEGQRIAYLSSKVYDQVFAYKLMETDYTTVYKLQNLHIITKLLGFARPQEAFPKFGRGIINFGYITEDEVLKTFKKYLRITGIPLENIGFNDMKILRFEQEYDDIVSIINQDINGQDIPSLATKTVLLALDTEKVKKYLNEGRKLLIQKFKFYAQDIKTKNVRTVSLLVRINIAKKNEVFLDYNLDKIDFGLKEVNIITTEDIVITNYSIDPIEIRIDIEGDVEFSTVKNLRLNLHPNQSFTVPVSFLPRGVQSYSGNLLINVYRNNSLLISYKIPLLGEGTNYKMPDFRLYNEITEELKPVLKQLQEEYNKTKLDLPI